MKIFIYGLIDPETKQVRYIGRTRSLKTRLKGHLSKASRKITHRDCWIFSLKEKSTVPEMIVLEVLENYTWQSSYDAERSWISFYIKTGHNLTNHHDRGEGEVNRVISKEQRKKISEKVKKLHNLGLLPCGRKAIDIYNLDGTFVTTVDSYTKAAEYVGVSDKHFQNHMKRNSNRIKNYMTVPSGQPAPESWRYTPRNNNATKKFRITKGDLTFTFDTKAKLNAFFGLNERSTKLNYYLSINAPFNHWMLNRMPE